MDHVDLVAVLAAAQLVFFSALLGRARARHGVRAPVVAGHGLFERIHRVQMNTMERTVAFLPPLFIAVRYGPQAGVAAAGAVYLVGRLVYWRSHTAAPMSRGPGFALSRLPIVALLLAALAGILRGATG